ncbi:GNAT family N-acetyltransferase [Kineococcus sp. G2]|uniref:GNAT family N-acetyltransferase n=1 Tax=Kineococcus sp. G2 TaxID=3127484 RepID=UPI00301D27E9
MPSTPPPDATTGAIPARTERLLLAPPRLADLEDVFALYSDPAVWEHLPSGRHTDRTRTALLLEHVRESWDLAGLGSWVARLAEGPEAGRLVGTGGCDLRLGVAWNLSYRLHRRDWGHGYAGELAAAAIAAARRVHPDVPVTAYLLEHNVRSAAVAQRAGLHLQWRGHDAGNPDPDAVRLLYADRPLSRTVLDLLVST